ncbi:hypothetical protein [Chromobacterium piscinae]|uniref:hypothetical protein n=1 Tax=Chromobacterium piscinae TaxID=686831 RepID=UPI00320B6B15
MTTDTLPAVSLEIDASQAPVIYTGKGLNVYFEHIKAMVNEVPDLATKKGRDRIASLAYKVSQSKAAVEKPGRDYLKLVKELPKKIEEELRDFVTQCDALRDSVRKPLTDWEAEQARIEAERIAAEKAAEEAAALARQIEADHEIGLLMNREHDRLAEEKRHAGLLAQQERDTEIARQAEEKARREAELKAEAERQAAIQREIDAKLATERAEQERLAAEQRTKDTEARAAREKADAEERIRQAEAKAEQDRLEAEERAKQAAIQAEADRIRAAEEAAAAERRRLEQEAEAKETEERRRAADRDHRGRINSEVLADLKASGLSEDQAKDVVCAIVKKQVRHVAIQY